MRLVGKPGPAHRAEVDEDGALRLALDEREERMPWLQGEEDEEEEGAPAILSGQVLAFVLGLVLVLALVAGAGWWLWRGAGSAPVADGSIIAAPAGPYKVRPADPGGQEALGTGDASFLVAEGGEFEGRVAPAAGTMAPDAPRGVGVQIGAYPTREEAQEGWRQMTARLPLLSGRSHRIWEGTSDNAPIFRLQVVTGDVASARDFCRQLREQGGDCQVKR